MITYRSLACPARWLVVLAAFWLGAALWSPGSHAFAAEPVPVASAVHVGEESSNDGPGLRCPQRSPVKRPRATGAPALACGPPAQTVRAAQTMAKEVPARGAGHAERLVRLSVWRV
ncbi:hypothetical protein ACQEVF_43990 [Nonomuraea polychroma]|uniref:hypothetical protein n=1 Tax=Nonomuraea polychroma TaxID=46176 RepID=UPI003D92FAFA